MRVVTRLKIKLNPCYSFSNIFQIAGKQFSNSESVQKYWDNCAMNKGYQRSINAIRKTLPLFGKGSEITKELLRNLKPSDDIPENNSAATSTEIAGPKDKPSELQIPLTKACVTCGISFDDREEQTAHFKTDWHRYNLKLRLRGLDAVTEEKFLELTDCISSISGSDSSDESHDGDDGAKDPYKALDTDDVLADTDVNIYDPVIHGMGQAKVFLRLASGQIISLYRAVVCSKKEKMIDSQDLLHLVEQIGSHNKWIIIMMGGGHFAAAVFHEGEVVAHKTFHRYVVRAKAGTSQSQYDKKGGMANSAGAQLRRYNEAALAQDIVELLESWKSYIAEAHRIFLRVSTNNLRYIFSKKETPYLKKGDLKIRMIPFPTRRATYGEVLRVYSELSSVTVNEDESGSTPDMDTEASSEKYSRNSPSKKNKKNEPAQIASKYDSLEESDSESEKIDMEYVYENMTLDMNELKTYDRYIPSPDTVKAFQETKAGSKGQGKKMNYKANDAEERSFLPFRSEFYTACVIGEVNSMRGLIDLHYSDISAESSDFSVSINMPINQQGQRLLHIACQYEHVPLVEYLLSLGCDPSLSDDSKTVPYLVTQNKHVRNAFRMFMADHPDRYDYLKAQIPGPLSRQQLEEKKAKEAERKKEINKKKKDRMKIQKAETAKQNAEEAEKKRFMALSDREKRALAAERRIMEQAQASGTSINVLSRCFECAKDITGKVPFEYNSFTFCTTNCLKTHRMKNKDTQK